ncbi:glycosyltransferase [Brevibacillus agri BAB-2500]|nr:glycosyltransferase [Brevibacillus agri BAB-2500]
MDYRNNTKFYFLNIDLSDNRTGIENAALMRTRLFHDHLKIVPTIVTTKYNPRLNIQRVELVNKGYISSDTKVINLYEYFQETITHECKLESNSWANNPKWIYKPVENKHDIRIYDEMNNLLVYRGCDDKGLIKYNNIFVNKKKVRRDNFDSNGYLSRTQHLDQETGQVRVEVYYRVDGTPCIYKHFDLINGKSSLTSIHLVNKNGDLIESFASEQEFISYWLNLILSEPHHHILIIDKERIYYPALQKINKSNVKIICMIHSSHLKEMQPAQTGKLNSNYAQIFENLSKPDAVVVLTNKQKEDIVSRFGFSEKIFVIPHAIDKKVIPARFETREPFKAIYLARYSKEKQHESLVRVFHRVVQNYPNAKLDLYGFGDQKENIVKFIKSLELDDNITVNEFVENPEEIYNNASLSVLTSKCEGFSLFVLESLAHGCPIVSYDIDYGPRDMIDHNVNGYLGRV